MAPMNQSPRRLSALLTMVCLLWLTVPLHAQDTRGSITGVVTDTSGGAVPGAAVSVINEATNLSLTTRTSGEGAYTVPFLPPGTYRVSVEMNGYKKLLRAGVGVSVADKLVLNLVLEPGAVTETVTVTSDATPLLESGTASFGQVVDRKRISELPLADGNPFALTRLTPGLSVFGTGFLGTGTQPFSTTDPSSISANGAKGGNEYTLDGAPNTVDERPTTGNRIGQQPPADAVQEFKVTTASFDAQQGHTAGATIDVAIRSGSNNFHGTLYEFLRNDALLNANNFFANRTAPRGLDENGEARKPVRRYNRFGGTIGGPLPLPRFGQGGPAIISGKDRTFFFASYEGIRTSTPKAEFITVPTLAQRQGDFSALAATGIVIYDPLTATRTGTRIVRQPFAGNIIPAARISPIAREYLKYFPAPNLPGDAQGRNNYSTLFASDNVYDWFLGRLDHTFSDKQRMFFRYSRGNRTENDENRTGITNGARATGFVETRTTNNAIYDHIYNLSPTTVLNLRAGFSRFYNPERSPSDGVVDPASLGFSPRAVSQFSARAGIPRLDIPGFVEIGGRSPDLVAYSIAHFQPTVTKAAGSQTVRFGYDYRVYRENATPPADVAGRYRFRPDFTRLNDTTSANAPIGQELAAFLLGLPASQTVLVRPSARSNQNIYQGFWFQDDWKIKKRLTLNLGLRYEYEGTTTERFNRNLRLFDTNLASPIEAAARAAYAAAPASSRPAELPVDAFRVRGGLSFADGENRSFFAPDRNNFQPRVGFAYQASDKTVLRGGYAIYAAPFTIDGVNQTGFDFTTSAVPTNDNGLTFVPGFSFADPFPGGIVEPPGASRGPASFVGQQLGGAVNLIAPTIDRRIAPLTIGPRRNPMIHRYELSLQRELPGKFLFEAAFIGSLGRDLTTYNDINALPRQYLSTDAARNPGVINFLETTFVNPFRGLPEAAGTAFATATVLQRQQLLRPFPQYQSIFAQQHDGRSRYDSLQLRLERRFANGVTLQGNWVYSKFTEQITRLNAVDAGYEKRLAEADAPHRVTISGIYELPFGRSRQFGRNMSRIADAVFGGYQFNFIYAYQTGVPLTLGNIYFNGDPSRLRIRYDGSTVDNVFGADLRNSGFYFNDAAVQTNGQPDFNKQRNDPRINLAQNLRTLPSRLSNLRTQRVNTLDASLIKNISVTEKVRLQLRFELLNTFNNPLFGAPDLNPRGASFGAVTGDQVNLPRELQAGIKLIF